MHKIITPRWKSLLAFIGIIVFVQFIGNLSTMPEIKGWYAELNKPFWNPPNWVFGPVWTALYIMLALAGWLLWENTPGTAREKFTQRSIQFYFIQLFLNFIWSPLFFKFHLVEIALIDITTMMIFTALIIKTAYRIDRRVSWLMIPYMAWITYAMTLNAGIAHLN